VLRGILGPGFQWVCQKGLPMFDDLTFFAMAKKSMDWLARRQEVLSENVANANSPNYQPRDLAPLDFKDVMKADAQPVRAVVTNPRHISPEVEAVKFDTVTEHRPEESKPDGNAVLLEEQMNKIGEVKGKYDLAVNLFQKNVAMLKTAIDRSGG
jgi:flagellar basal-body rod protein FlgB